MSILLLMQDAVAPHWVWALIAGGCVGLLLFRSGIIKIHRR